MNMKKSSSKKIKTCKNNFDLYILYVYYFYLAVNKLVVTSMDFGVRQAELKSCLCLSVLLCDLKQAT